MIAIQWANNASVTLPATRLSCVEWLQSQLHYDRHAAMQLESSVYVSAQDALIYSTRMKEVMYNLWVNPELRTVDVDTLGRMSTGKMREGTVLDIAAHEDKLRCERFAAMLQERYDSVGEEVGHTDFSCRRCGSRSVSMEQKQTRSADEPTTVFVTCKQCQTRWRLN